MIELITTPTTTIAVDIVGVFGSTSAAELTDYPIEDGSTRSDHKIINPRTLEIVITQTEYPIDDPQYSMQPLSLDFAVNQSAPSPLDLEFEAVRTQIMSPFLLAGGAIRAGVGAVGDALFGAAPANKFTGLKPDGTADQSVVMQTYQTATPRDRGGELDDLLQELFDSDDVAEVTYRGRTHPNMSLIGLTRTFNIAGLTEFACSFKQLRKASIGLVALPDPAALALKAKQSVGKGKPAVKEAPAKPKSILKSIAG